MIAFKPLWLVLFITWFSAIRSEIETLELDGVERFGRDLRRIRQKKDASTNFKSIHNKLVEVARFANGLALSESLAQGKINFGRMVTGLMVAGQFPFELDRIQLLVDSPHTGIDKIVSQLGSFESFLEGKTKFNVSDVLIKELIASLIYGQEIIKMKQQSAAMQKLMGTLQKEADSFKNVAKLILGANLDVSIEAASVLGSLPETIRSYPILMKEKDQILTILTDAFDYLKLLNNETLTAQLLGNFSNFINATDMFRKKSMEVPLFSYITSTLRGEIIAITNSPNSDKLREDVIEDCSKVITFLGYSNESIDHLEKLANHSEDLSIFQTTLEQISQTGHSNEIKKIDYILAKTLHSTTKELEIVSDFMKQMKPEAEIVEWAKSVSSSVRTKRSPSNKPGHKQKFLEQMKLLSAFNGTKSFINAASLSNSEKLDKNENIELVRFEEKISQQLKSVELWVDQVGSSHIVDDAIRSILSMMKNKKNFLKLQSQQKKLNKLTDDIDQLGNVHHAEIGYRKFLKLLKWLRKIPNWKENIQKIKGEEETESKNEQGLILHHISEVIAFFKQFNKIINTTYPSETQLSEVSKIPNLQLKLESLNFLVGYYNNKAMYEQFIEGAALSYGTDIKDALISGIIWKNVTNTEMSTDEENGDVENSFKLINGYKTSLDTIETNRKILDEINKDTKVLEGLCKAAEAMSNEVIVSYGKGLKAMRGYNWTLPAPSSLVPTNLSQLIVPRQSDSSVIESLTKNIRVLFDLMKESSSANEIKNMRREMIAVKKLPDVAKNFITLYEAWLDGAENMEFLSYEIGLSSMNFLNEIGKIGKKIAKLHDWLKSVPERSKKARVKRSFGDLRKSIAGIPQEKNFKKLINLVEKAQDSKTSEAVKQLGKDLETLAASFGYKNSHPMPIPKPTEKSDPSREKEKVETAALHASPESSKQHCPVKNCSKESAGSMKSKTLIIIHVAAFLASMALFILLALTTAYCFYLKFRNNNLEKEDEELVNSSGNSKRVASVKKDTQEERTGTDLLNQIFPGYAKSRNVFKSFLNWENNSKEPYSTSDCKPCSQKTPCEVAKYKERPLNRFSERTTCHEKNSIFVDLEPKYVNAIPVKMPSGAEFIAAQGPLEHTIDSFFNLIEMKEVEVVVMLGNFIEMGVEQSADYMKSRKDGEYSVSNIKKMPCSLKGVEHSELTIKRPKTEFEKTIQHLHLKSWEREDDLPAHFNSLPQLLQSAKDKNSSNGRILVHCADGTNRTMVFIGMEYIYQIHTKEKEYSDKMEHAQALNEMKHCSLLKKSQLYMMYFGMLKMLVSCNKIKEQDLCELPAQFVTAMEMYLGKAISKKTEIVEGSKMAQTKEQSKSSGSKSSGEKTNSNISGSREKDKTKRSAEKGVKWNKMEGSTMGIFKKKAKPKRMKSS